MRGRFLTAESLVTPPNIRLDFFSGQAYRRGHVHVEYHRQNPSPELAPFVDYYWYFTGLDAGHAMEHVVPDGTVELIIDLRDEPRRLFDPKDLTARQTVRSGWVSGAQSGHIVIDVRPGASMIGAHFRPGGAGPVLGMPVETITDQVVELKTLWTNGGATDALRGRLLTVPGATAKFRTLDQFLVGCIRRAPAARWKPDRVAAAVALLSGANGAAGTRSIADIAASLGVSHKHFIDEFRRTVGLTPKRFAQIHRFQGVLTAVRSLRVVEWADVAVKCGYYDQSHFIHDFQIFAGMNPSAFLTRTVDDPKFIPIEDWDVG